MLDAAAQLFSSAVAFEEIRGEVSTGTMEADPGELAQVAGACERRRNDFLRGRACARRALCRLGAPHGPLLSGEDRCPVWPPGFVGSISHTEGYCGAAAAATRQLRSIGFDAERVGTVGEAGLHVFCTPRERRFLAGLEGAARREAVTVIFAAKEAFYKCEYLLLRRSLCFHDVEVQLDGGALHLGLTRPVDGLGPAGASFPLRCVRAGGLVLVGCLL